MKYKEGDIVLVSGPFKNTVGKITRIVQRSKGPMYFITNHAMLYPEDKLNKIDKSDINKLSSLL